MFKIEQIITKNHYSILKNVLNVKTQRDQTVLIEQNRFISFPGFFSGIFFFHIETGSVLEHDWNVFKTSVCFSD